MVPNASPVVGRRYIALSHVLASEEQIPDFFRQVNLQVPDTVKSVLDAKIEFAEMSFENGCRRRTDSATYLGILLLRQNHDLEKAIHYLEIGVKDRPTRQGLLALSSAYKSAGRIEDAALLQEDASDHPEMFGSASPH